MRMLRMATVVFVAAMVFAPSAFAERVKPNIHFFSGAQDDAHWTPHESADPNRMSIELEVGPAATGGVGYAGFELNHVEGTPAPTREPRFFHKEDRPTLSGGSPRLVIVFSDGGNIQLRPDQWSTSWQFVGEGDGDGNWDSNGGACIFQYDVQYQQALACHPGAVVQEVLLVTDSNWMADKANGYINWIDRFQYNGFEYSHASDNNNSAAGTS